MEGEKVGKLIAGSKMKEIGILAVATRSETDRADSEMCEVTGEPGRGG